MFTTFVLYILSVNCRKLHFIQHMKFRLTKSKRLYKTAENLMPGGVNSPVRSFSAVTGTPVFISHAKGAYIYDVDGNKYIDYLSSLGPLIHGHADPDVVRAIKEAAVRGTSYGAPCRDEVVLAKLIVGSFPSIEKLRMTNSGTEATMSAVRLARAYTKRDYLVKFEGCYHGHADYLLVKAGSGATTFGTPSSPGVPKSFTDKTLLAKYNDISSVERLFRKIMDMVAPAGPVYQAGTLSGNPLAMAAGIASLTKLKGRGNYERLRDLTSSLVEGISGAIKKTGVNACINSVESMFTLFFTDVRPYDYPSALSSNTKMYSKFFDNLLKAGIMFPPSQFEAVFLSLAHSEKDVNKTIEAAYKSLKAI